MFLRSLKIENRNGIIRILKFQAGLNLIVDETPTDQQKATGNNVGKTTVLKLIDFCLGAEAKRIYTDLENPKVEYLEIKRFLIDTQVLIALELCESLERASERDIIIERNFLPRNQIIRRINGQSYTDEGFEEYLTNHLVPGHFGRKPTFGQIISHNIRYKDQSVTNTLRTLNSFTRDDEYEALYLFLLGCDFSHGNEKQVLLAKLRTETSFVQRLERVQTRSAYEISLSLLLEEIKELEVKRTAFRKTPDLDNKIRLIGDLKYKRSALAAELSQNRLRRDLVNEAVREVVEQKSEVDLNELGKLYQEVSDRFGKLTRDFDDLLTFHNRMVEEKVRYIAKDIPMLDQRITRMESELRALTYLESQYIEEMSRSGLMEDMEKIVLDLNDRHRRRGEYETIIQQISEVDTSIRETRERLAKLDQSLFSDESTEQLQAQLAKFNRQFSSVSDELYGERYAMKFDRAKTQTGQPLLKFSCFNTNFSSGKKQGEITCFDIGYTLFADEEGIPCYHFLLNDKKELMDDHQLEGIGKLVERKSSQIQYVASILRDKLPPNLNKEEYVVVKLSQTDKLFRLESGGRPPLDSLDATRKLS